MWGKKDAATDREILAGLRTGGITRQRYENLFFMQYKDFVRLRPRKYRISDEEALDAYTEAFLAVVDNVLAGSFRGEASLKTYLSRIFRNKCVDQHRKNTTVKTEWVEEFPELPDTSRDFLKKLMGEERLERVSQFIERLGERCRDLLMLAAWGYSPAEIAEKMDFSTPHSASSQRHKCLTKLKEMMAGVEEYEE
ncbi:MAG: sigma-70 family RNA polymerase sigma factor [Bacteroidia bacterium]|nr:sigma-70 family RNA polymerase sigma factor [Bacteroidia bacterium]